MDSTETITHVSLCAGYGGIDLGLRRVIPNVRTVAACEIEAFAVANLASKMEAGLLDAAPVWTNLKTFPFAEFRDRVDILSGGYPCQPFSAAGKRLGKDDPRHLWPWIADGIDAMRPRWCFFENVEGHISKGLRDVLSDLEGRGYEATWGIFSAAEVGAPHQRKRVFILAHRVEQGSQRRLHGRADQERQGFDGHAGCGGSGPCGRGSDVWPSRPGEPQHGWEPPRVVDAEGRESKLNAMQGRPEGGERGEHTIGFILTSAVGGEPPRVVGDTSIRQDNRREPGNLAETQGCGERGDDAVDGTSEGELADNSKQRRDGRPNWACRRIGQQVEVGKDVAGSGGKSDGLRQTQPPLGRDPHGPADGLDLSELSGLSDSELAEIRDWMERCDNRTDELRLLGNGVVPATAERAFRVLYEELADRTNQRCRGGANNDAGD